MLHLPSPCCHLPAATCCHLLLPVSLGAVALSTHSGEVGLVTCTITGHRDVVVGRGGYPAAGFSPCRPGAGASAAWLAWGTRTTAGTLAAAACFSQHGSTVALVGRGLVDALTYGTMLGTVRAVGLGPPSAPGL